MSDGTSKETTSPWIAVMPGLFVGLWSTGFIGAKLGLPHAEPMTFLAIRFAIVTILLGAIALVAGAPWPRRKTTVLHTAVVGILVHGVYLGGVFSSIYQGVPAGVAALIVGIQPLLTAAIVGPLLGERVTARQWGGLVLGLAGVLLVVWNKLDIGEGNLFGMALAGFALLGITAGTVYQKRFGGAQDLRTANAIQFFAAALVVLPFAFAFETMRVNWTGEFVFALTWLILVLSVGAISLLYLLLRRGAAARVASLFYMVPPCTALLAFFLFGETLGLLSLIGMAAAVIGVAIVNLPDRRRRPRRPADTTA